MTLVKHELRQGKTSFLIWTTSIGFLLAICIFLFPEMKGQMEGVNDMFASMGSFTEAFGMDRLNFGTLIGFYAVECGNILGLGGAFYAALCAVGILSHEEGQNCGISADSPCQPQKDYYRKADCGVYSDYSYEYNHLRTCCRLRSRCR